MSSSLLRSSILRSTISTSSSSFQIASPFCQSLRLKHTVRIILVHDLPTGKAYKGDVIHVAAGYMRNYLLPKKIALYATPQNFERLGRTDPESETADERRQRLERMASDELNEDLKAANLLTKYLNGKMVSLLLGSVICVFVSSFERHGSVSHQKKPLYVFGSFILVASSKSIAKLTTPVDCIQVS